MQTPVVNLGACTFMYKRVQNVYIVAVTRANANAVMAFAFIDALVELLRSYFGKVTEHALKQNFVVVYELLDEIIDQRARGIDAHTAVIESAVGRLRPVLLAAATTVLGVLPLLQDIFWVAMAVTIMAGLAFGTVLTMVAVPVLYAIFFRVESPRS